MSDSGKLRGVIPPIITPTDSKGRVNEEALRAEVNWLIGQGVHGFFIGGTAGEGPLLTQEQYKRLMTIVHQENHGRVSLLAGVQETSTARVIEKMNIVRDIGIMNYVVTPSFYIPIKSHEEQMLLFRACHEAAPDMTLFPYNIPQVTQSCIAIETFQELARSGIATYCKESSGNPDYFMKLIPLGKKVGLNVFIGDELRAAEAMLAGAAGMVNVCSNVEPKTYVKLYEAAVAGNKDECARRQKRVNELVTSLAMASHCFLAGPKYAQGKRLGRDMGTPLSPLAPLTAEQMKKIDAFLAGGML